MRVPTAFTKWTCLSACFGFIVCSERRERIRYIVISEQLILYIPISILSKFKKETIIEFFNSIILSGKTYMKPVGVLGKLLFLVKQ